MSRFLPSHNIQRAAIHMFRKSFLSLAPSEEFQTWSHSFKHSLCQVWSIRPVSSRNRTTSRQPTSMHSIVKARAAKTSPLEWSVWLLTRETQLRLLDSKISWLRATKQSHLSLRKLLTRCLWADPISFSQSSRKSHLSALKTTQGEKGF